MQTETWARRSPWTGKYWQRELRWYGMHKHGPSKTIYEADGLLLSNTRQADIVRLDDWLNVNMRTDVPPVPQLYRDGLMWMSLTPMEVQAQHLPIQWACGKAATGGLGLGQFALRAAEKDDVDEVHVFEIDERVIRMFQKLHGHRKAFQKIRIHHGDARELMTGEYAGDFDTIYLDIYPYAHEDIVLEDLRALIPTLEEPCGFTWWGMEPVMLNAVLYELVHPWQRSALGKLRYREVPRSYCERVVAVLAEHCWL